MYLISHTECRDIHFHGKIHAPILEFLTSILQLNSCIIQYSQPNKNKSLLQP